MKDTNDQDKDLKYFWGMPMRWDAKNMFKGLWAKDDDRIFTPKHFGIGWSLNFHALCKKCGLIKKDGLPK